MHSFICPCHDGQLWLKGDVKYGSAIQVKDFFWGTHVYFFSLFPLSYVTKDCGGVKYHKDKEIKTHKCQQELTDVVKERGGGLCRNPPPLLGKNGYSIDHLYNNSLSENLF